MEKKANRSVWFQDERKVRLILLLAAIALGVKYIFVDFGIDAEFQISMSYRFAEGDLMFKEMWEPYQMSAFLCAFFIKIYTAIFHTTTGIVLFLQLIGVAFDAAVAFLLYKVANKYLEDRKGGNVSFAMAWVFFVVSPKDVPLPEYANMQVWFTMLVCITMFLYYKTKKKFWVVLSALCLCGTVLSYPSCLILFAGVLILLLSRGDKAGSLIFGVTCLSAGALYLLCVFRQVSFDEFAIFVENMLSLETSHSVGWVEKYTAYLKQAVGIAIFFGIAYGIACTIVCGLFRVLARVLPLKAGAQDRDSRRVLTDMLFCGIVLLGGLYTVIFWKEYLRYCYSVVFPAIILIGTHYRKKLSPDKRAFYLCATILSCLQFIATLLLTNLELIASVPYLLIAVIAAFMPIAKGLESISVPEAKKKVKAAVVLCGVLFLVFRNSYIIRPMNGDVSSILEIGGIVKSGPAIGIVSEYMGPYIQNESMKEWEQYVKPGDSIYLIGGSLDTLGYLYCDTIVAAPTLVPTPGYNESVLEYWRLNPQKYPDVIIASCWYGSMNADLAEDSWIMKWIEEEYQPRSYADGKYWRYYFK